MNKKNKRLWLGGLCFGGFVMLASGVSQVFAYPNEPDGFRDIKWQTEKAQIDGIKIHEKHGSYVEYTRDSEDINFEGLPATRIIYGFTQDRLETVTVRFESSGEGEYQALRKSLITQFGDGQEIGEKDMFWGGDQTNIKLNTYGNGVDIFFSDGATFGRRLNKIDAFNVGFKEYWNGLLEKYDAKTAAVKLKEWLAVEGEELLDSYHVSEDGDQIGLDFKGGGMYMFTPSPSNVQRETQSERVYNVTEVLRLLVEDPGKLKAEDTFVKATVVDGVMGLGCHDYAMLTDQEFVDLYSRRYKPQEFTADEREAIKRIPILLSGPTLSMSKGVLSQGESVYRGHFFDNSMKSCKDGEKRFVIMDKK